MYRIIARGSQVVIDILVLSAAYGLAFTLRFEFSLTLAEYKQLFFTWPYVAVLQYLALALFRVPRFAWRYVGLRDATTILLAIASSTTVLVTARLVLAPLGGYATYVAIPLGVLGMNFFLAYLGITGVRVLRRIIVEKRESGRRRVADTAVPTMLIGAGDAGVLVAKELKSRPDLGIEAVGFLDDHPMKVGRVIQGIPVVGTTKQAKELCETSGARQALITIANAAGREIRRITAICDDAQIPAKIIPGIYEIVGGRVNLSRIRNVAIEDLLGREPVVLDNEAISAFIHNKVVLITGAGGSIGSEICRQASQFGPAKLVLVERFENALFEIHSELGQKLPELTLAPRIADITDSHRMQQIFARQRPDVVFHAAAHKHVPMMEWNPGEAIKNNVLGTKALADLAAERGVSHLVMISTDKAVNPKSVMGASKRVAELYVQAMAKRFSSTTFVSVRFGNVLGSSGSVIPIFKKQIAAGGPVTVTHPDMRRYFMTVPEATQLVLQAATMGEGGEVFILDMGEPVRIVDLARDLIRLSGLEPETDIEIQLTGVRPGEKLFEELATDEEKADKTQHGKIFVGKVRPADWQALNRGIADLSEYTDEQDERRIYEALRAMIPEFSGTGQPQGEPEHALPPIHVVGGKDLQPGTLRTPTRL